jgi:hypothetical protein
MQCTSFDSLKIYKKIRPNIFHLLGFIEVSQQRDNVHLVSYQIRISHAPKYDYRSTKLKAVLSVWMQDLMAFSTQQRGLHAYYSFLRSTKYIQSLGGIYAGQFHADVRLITFF